MFELIIKDVALCVRRKNSFDSCFFVWEVVLFTKDSSDIVIRTVLYESETYEDARLFAEDYTILYQVCKKACSYNFDSFRLRWTTMSFSERINQCKEILKIYDTLQQSDSEMAFDAICNDDFNNVLLFLEMFCMRYFVDNFRL